MARKKKNEDQLDLLALLDADAQQEKEEPAPEPVAVVEVQPAPAPVVKTSPDPRPLRIGPGRLAEAVSESWFSQHLGARIEIPIGVVGFLSLMRQADPNGPSLQKQLLELSPQEWERLFVKVRGLLWVSRPYLVTRMSPIQSWIDDKPDKRLWKGVQIVARTALRNGLLDMTGSPDPVWRAEHDVLGRLVTEMRSHGSRKGLGEYHTPKDVADLMAQMTFGPDLKDHNPAKGQWFTDPAAGTGGLLRSAAQALRYAGYDPADYVWAASEIDPIASACFAVNTIVWGLGPNVLAACVDTLRDGDGIARELEERNAILAHRDNVVGEARMRAWVRRLDRLLDGMAADAA